MSEVLDLPAIDPALIDTTGTAPTPPAALHAVAVAGGAVLDLKKLDLTAVALAQFGDWRAAVAKLKADNEKTVLVLPTQAKIDEAVSLRQRTIKAPLAEARKVEAALKSKLAQTSKAVGAELAALIAGYDDAGVPLTLQIDAAQKKLDDEKAAKAAAEAARLQGLRDAVDGIMAKWLDRCTVEGITAERIAKGGDLFSALPMPAEVADVSVYWDTKVGTTLAEMRKLHGAALAREEAARLEAQRIENERIAAEQARVAAELAERQRALAEQAAALARQAEEIEAARQRAITPAAPAATEGKADTPEPGKLEAAPITQDAQESGFSPADAPACTSSGAEAAEASPSGDEGTARADHSAPVSAWRYSTSRAWVTRKLAERDANTQDTTSAATPTLCDTDDHGADLLLDPGTAAAEAAEFAELEALTDGPPGGFVTSDLLDACADFVALVAQARGTNFPSQPKMGPEWWTALYAAADKMRATGEVL